MEAIDKYPHIPFERSAVTRRAKETPEILRGLELVAEHVDGEHKLYRNPGNGELWQRSNAWNWGAKPYCFLVPAIATEDWKQEPFVDPDEMLIFTAVMSQFLAQPSVRQMANLKAHVENLQQVKMLPRYPTGRWFGPYKKENIIPNLEQAPPTLRR